MTEHTKELKEKEGLEHKEAFARAAKEWGSLSEKEKQKYNAMHEDDKKRYEKQKAEFDKKGYYTMEDGSRSTDQQAKKKRASKRGKSTSSSARKGKKSAAGRKGSKKRAS